MCSAPSSFRLRRSSAAQPWSNSPVSHTWAPVRRHTRMNAAPQATAMASATTPPLWTTLIPTGTETSSTTARAATAWHALSSGGTARPTW